MISELRRSLAFFRPKRFLYWNFPQLYWQPYSRKVSQQGIDHLCLILSFDCDTDEDATAALKLDEWLRKRGVKAVYAVPGQQLERSAEIYRQIAAGGAEFINHGALPHAERRGDRYVSITFYHQMSDQEVENDIRRGHEIVEQVIGQTPHGFRAPHFGYVAPPDQLARVHRILQQLDYLYSSSTMPRVALEHGAIWEVENGFYEIPVMGSYYTPLVILDSWSHVESPQHPYVSRRYAKLFQQTVDALLARRIPAVLNYYVDPAHVVESPAFYEAIEYALDRGVVSLDYRGLLR